MLEISIVIPAYNAMKYLPYTVDSILQQTYTDFEVIIVNDGSSDGIETWFEQSISDPRFKLISQQNQGTATARNVGIGDARGELIAFLDSDDLWHPTKLEKQVQKFKENPDIGLVYTWLQYVDAFAVPTGKVVKSSFQGNVWEQLTAFNFVGCGSNAMVRRSCFESVGNFDGDLNAYVEDWDMWLRVAKKYPFGVIEEALVYNRKYAGSVSTHWQKMEQGFPKVIEKAFASAPSELIKLKNRSYAHADLCLGWKAIQGKQKDLKMAVSFWRKSFLRYPQMVFYRSFMNLSVVLFLLTCFGLDRYDSIQSLILTMRRRVLALLPS